MKFLENNQYIVVCPLLCKSFSNCLRFCQRCRCYQDCSNTMGASCLLLAKSNFLRKTQQTDGLQNKSTQTRRINFNPLLIRKVLSSDFLLYSVYFIYLIAPSFISRCSQLVIWLASIIHECKIADKSIAKAAILLYTLRCPFNPNGNVFNGEGFSRLIAKLNRHLTNRQCAMEKRRLQKQRV